MSLKTSFATFHRRPVLLALAVLLGIAGSPAWAQDAQPGQPGHVSPPPPSDLGGHFGSSPFDPPETNDSLFVVDQDIGLDTGCTFRSGGPLIFTLEVDRVVRDAAHLAQLKANGLVSETAVLEMPAFDVDFDANIPNGNPERDRVSFNGHVVPEEFLRGENNVWRRNTFRVPIEWVQFASDPGLNGTAVAADNVVRIDIDVANTGELWCTSIDWAALSFDMARPVILAHGILSKPSDVWNPLWVPQLEGQGIFTEAVNLGRLPIDSIQLNAQKIANKVDKALHRWGVDKVNLVAHSKGGLDSRHYAENAETVDQIVQLGTPNAGSRLADFFQVVGVGILGPEDAILANLLIGRGAIQLTRPYMALYNLFHGRNPNVEYTSLAGKYDPDCTIQDPNCRPLDLLFLAITGPGDTVVPVSSAHALPYTLDRTFESSGDNRDATHFKIPRDPDDSALYLSDDVYDRTKDRVLRVGRSATVGAGEGIPILASTAAVAEEILQGETRQHTIPVEKSGAAFFSLLYGSGEMELSLVSPSGEVIDASAADADPEIEHQDGGVLGGRLAVFSLARAEAGLWTVVVQAVQLEDPTMPAGYVLNAWVEEPTVTFAGSFGEAAVTEGEGLTLTATLLDAGAPLAGAAVEAHVRVADGPLETVPLADDGQAPDTTAGDGIYSGRFPTQGKTGLVKVGFEAAGTTASGAPFSREVFGLATVSTSDSRIAGTFRDFGRDLDGDGLFDQLAVEVDLDITKEARYRLFGVLTDAAGNRHEASRLLDLAPGAAAVRLLFDGERIFDNRVDGPYTLAQVRLAEEDGLAILPVDEAAGAYQTAAYAYTEFEHPPIRLTGGGSATGVDTDGNGLYDLLEVRIGVEVDTAGVYEWSGRLIDRNVTELGFESGSAFFDAGAAEMLFVFDGEAIGSNGIDGPYRVSDLLVFGAGASLVEATAFTTPPFAASEFEGFVPDTTAPLLEAVLSPTSLTPPDGRLVEVTAAIQVSDARDPNPQVTLVSITSSDSASPGDDIGSLDKNNIQEAEIGSDDRQFLLRAENDDLTPRVYTITYEARDAAGNTATTEVTVEVPLKGQLLRLQ